MELFFIDQLFERHAESSADVNQRGAGDFLAVVPHLLLLQLRACPGTWLPFPSAIKEIWRDSEGSSHAAMCLFKGLFWVYFISARSTPAPPYLT